MLEGQQSRSTSLSFPAPGRLQASPFLKTVAVKNVGKGRRNDYGKAIVAAGPIPRARGWNRSQSSFLRPKVSGIPPYLGSFSTKSGIRIPRRLVVSPVIEQDTFQSRSFVISFRNCFGTLSGPCPRWIFSSGVTTLETVFWNFFISSISPSPCTSTKCPSYGSSCCHHWTDQVRPPARHPGASLKVAVGCARAPLPL